MQLCMNAMMGAELAVSNVSDNCWETVAIN